MEPGVAVPLQSFTAHAVPLKFVLLHGVRLTARDAQHPVPLQWPRIGNPRFDLLCDQA